MLKRYQKNLFYKFCSPLMRINALRIKIFKSFKDTPLKLHLGPGKKNILMDGLTLMLIFLLEKVISG